MRKTSISCVAARWCAVALACAAMAAGAVENYPSKPVRVIVPFPAGSSPDIVARYLSGKLAERMGQPFVVDNRAGAGGMLGAEAVAKARPTATRSSSWSIPS